MKVRYIMYVYGEVQGVGYRYAARDQARVLSLCGFVNNDANGSVSIDIEGEQKDVHTFLQWVRKGPSGARVDRVDFFLKSSLKGYADFSIQKRKWFI